MKTKPLLIIGAVLFLLPFTAIATFHGDALAQQSGESSFRIEVSQHGFNSALGETQLEVEEGQEVEITFVYGDDDLSFNNPHIIFITGYNIKADTLDRENPEVTVSFIAGQPGEIKFMCVLSCEGHDNIQKGRITVLPSTTPPTAEGDDQLLLTVPEQAQSGQPLILTAVLRDSQDEPTANAPVKFLIEADFFISDLMEIGETRTNDEGIATLEYIPRLFGNIHMLARYNAIEATRTLITADSNGSFYHAEAGFQLPSPGNGITIGDKGDDGSAPKTVFRLPWGILSWLLLVAAIIVLVWSTYFRVLYQVLRIPIATETEGTDTRLVPRIGMAAVVIVGIVLLLMVLTGPVSHPHLGG